MIISLVQFQYLGCRSILFLSWSHWLGVICGFVANRSRSMKKWKAGSRGGGWDQFYVLTSSILRYQPGVGNKTEIIIKYCIFLKCIWSEKWFLLIWKAFQNTEEWRFSFWNTFFRFRDINVFLLCKLDQWWRHIVCN